MNSSGSKSSDSNDKYDGSFGAELLAAIREGRPLDEILRILEGDPTLIHVTDPVGDTALHVVARAGHLEVAKQLVGFVETHGLTEVLMEQNLQGDTPLHLAVTNRHEHLARLLYLANFAANSVVNEDGKTPEDLAREVEFFFYVPKPDHEFDDEFFSPGVGDIGNLKVGAYAADIEMEHQYAALGESPSSESPPHMSDEEKYMGKANDLHAAIIEGREDLVLEALREYPGLIRHRCARSVLHQATETGQVGMLRLLVGQMNPDEAASLMIQGDWDDNTPLHIALRKNHEDAARYLFELAPEAAYQVNGKGVSPLYLAVDRGYQDLVKYVFQAMPVTAIPPSTKKSLLAPKKASLVHAAIRTANLGILDVVMKELPQLIDIPDYKGWKPLSYAAYKGYLEGVRYLLTSFPSSVKKYDTDGSLPIHKAVGGGHVSIVKEFVLRCPQTLYDVDRKGQSVLHFAVKCAKADVLSYLTKETTEAKKIFYLKNNEGKTFIDLANKLKR